MSFPSCSKSKAFLASAICTLGLVAACQLTPILALDARPGAEASPSTPAPSSLITIESDAQLADNQTGIVTATGNVRITYPEKGMVATSQQAQYFSKEGRLVLSGDVDVIDSDGQRIRAERLVYHLDQERLTAQPPSGKQVMSKIKLSPLPSQRVAPLMP